MSNWLIVCLLMSVAYAMLILIYYVAWLFIPKRKKNHRLEPKHGYTILVPARNEAANIEACLQSILLQQYPSALIELIVIDDNSTDQTATLVQGIAQDNIRCLMIMIMSV